MRKQRFFRTDAAPLLSRERVHRNQRPPRQEPQVCLTIPPQSDNAKVPGRIGRGDAVVVYFGATLPP
jgi:hypothetical protein